MQGELLKAAVEIARDAGGILSRYFGQTLVIEYKSSIWDLVTAADKASEEAIISAISKRFPNHSILAEESGEHLKEKSSYLWVVDPLDGTTNFAHALPFFSISIGIVLSNEVIAGVIYNPINQEIFTAEKGKGALLNNRSISVSATPRIESSLLATGFPYNRDLIAQNNYAEFCRLTSLSQGVRRFGSAALDLAYVAAGRLDGYWESGLAPWDLAAGSLIVKEAGGVLSDYKGGAFDFYTGCVLATNGLIHQQMCDALDANKA